MSHYWTDESCNSDTVFSNQSSATSGNNNHKPLATHLSDSQSSSYGSDNNRQSNYQNDCNSDNNPNYNNNNNNNSMHGLRMPPDGPPPPQQRGPRYRSNNHRDFSYLMRPPHMQDGNFPMHRMNFGPPPPPPPSYRSDGNAYGPPPPHFRNQW